MDNYNIMDITQQKQKRKETNKRYYDKVKEEHKARMLEQYYNNRKYEYIKLFLYNIDGTLNNNFIEEYNKAFIKCNEDQKYKIKVVQNNKIS